MTRILRILAVTLLIATEGLSPVALGQDQNTQTSSAGQAGTQTASPTANAKTQPMAEATKTTEGTTTKDMANVYSKSIASLTMLFVIAVLLENALAVLFNWRVFLAYFSVRGIRPLIMILGAGLIVWILKVDIISALISNYQVNELASKPIASEFPTQLLTTLILAGGSSGVYNIMSALGFRDDRLEAELEAKPPPNKAWVAVRVLNPQGLSDIQVNIENLSANPPVPFPTAIAGTVKTRRPSIVELLFRNLNRFPQNGGHTLEPGVPYKILVTAKRGTTDVQALGTDYVFAPGAIVDFDVTLA
jgi:hypothetical protein